MTNRRLCTFALLLTLSVPGFAQTGLISTVAGNGAGLFLGDGGPATSASIYNPYGLAVDPSGNLYLCDTGNNRVRRVDAATGIITTVAGSGLTAFSGDGGPATSANLNTPYDVKLDSAGNLFISDSGNQRVRRVDAITGIITTVAGNGTAGYNGDGGPAINASLNSPAGLAIDAVGNLYIADEFNYRVRRVNKATGLIATVSGNGANGFTGDGGPATAATMSAVVALALDQSGNLFVADMSNRRVRRIDSLTGVITTVVGTGNQGFNGDGIPATAADLYFPGEMVLDAAGNLLVVDGLNGRVRIVNAATGLIWTVAGNGVLYSSSGDGLQATSASLNGATGLALDSSGKLFISERNGNRVRRVALPSPFISTAVNLSASSTSVQLGDAVTFTATLSSNSATGNVSFLLDDTNVVATVPVTNGSASFTTSTLALHYHRIAASFGGDSAFGTSMSPVISVNVNPLPTTTTLTTSPNPSAGGQQVVMTAAVSPSSVGGSVNFESGGLTLATVNLSNGIAVFSTSFANGSYVLVAQYNGDATHNWSNSPSVTQTVKSTSSVTLGSNVNPSLSGQAVVFSAVVNSSATGTVQFFDGGVSIGTAALNAGLATLATSTLTFGTRLISAVYSGDANFLGSTSGTLTQLVKTSAAVVISSSANPVGFGQPITFSATVSPLAATGTVQFLDGATLLQTSNLVNGTASFTTSGLAVGVHSLKAVYSGDFNTATGSSPALSETVTKASTSVTLTSSRNPAPRAAAVVFSTTIAPKSATGTVQFLDGSILLGTAALSVGTASLTTSSLAVATHPITAVYSGDANYNGSTSPVLNQVITKH